MKAIIALLITSFLVFSCRNQQNREEYSKTLSAHFTEIQINEFNDMLNVLKETSKHVYLTDSINNVFKYLFYQFSVQQSLDEHRERISNVFKEQTQLLDALTEETKIKIWKKTNSSIFNSGLDFNLNGEWIQFLKALSGNEQYLFLAEYVEAIENAGGQSPASSWFFYENQQKLNFNDMTLRLIVTINYLTVLSNDPSNTSEKQK